MVIQDLYFFGREKIEIKDIDKCKYLFEVQAIVNAGLMSLKEGEFNPSDAVFLKELVGIIEKARTVSKK